MTPALVVVPLVLVVAVVAAVVVLARRRQPDTVDTFRRQIDALSPEARRNVVERVQRIEQDEPDDGT